MTIRESQPWFLDVSSSSVAACGISYPVVAARLMMVFLHVVLPVYPPRDRWVSPGLISKSCSVTMTSAYVLSWNYPLNRRPFYLDLVSFTFSVSPNLHLIFSATNFILVAS